MIAVEVAYAKPEKQLILRVDVPAGTSAIDAVAQSGITSHFPEIDLEQCKLGVFGKSIKHEQALQMGDRVEIYRPLIADPKAMRKKRAAEGKAMKKGAGDA